MSWLGWLLRRAKRPDGPMRDLRALVAPHVVPALHLVADSARGLSHFGGDPQLPPGVSWPERGGQRLALLARVSLAEVQRALLIPWLPSEGALLFFYDVAEQPWGFDPRDRGGWAVLHVPDVATPTATTESAAPVKGVLASRNMRFERIDSLPSHDRAERVGALSNLTDRESDAYFDLIAGPFGDRPQHQLAGWPSPIQGDEMEREAQLASNGIYCGDGTEYESAAARALESGTKDWRLLLQFDSDEHLDVMWGDAGMLYFWIREQDAVAGRFDNVWVILQCH